MTTQAPTGKTYVFGYGSLIWYTGDVTPISRREITLTGYHRHWKWISKSRGGAPTCCLEDTGSVKGVLLEINPDTRDADLECIRRRERRETELTIPDFPKKGDVTFTWTMGNNLSDHGLAHFEGDALIRELADRSVRTTAVGRDGRTSVQYIQGVHQFDPDDPITAALAEALDESR